jgi:DNA repair exonuclease SbcCD ATPase subunit
MEGLRVAHIKISNILGIADFELTPGKFTAITGRNGSGKTSILEAIKGALKGGHDATLLRNGAENGEVVLVLDDGTQIKKRITQAGSKLEFRDATGAKAAKPADSIRELIDALAVNPIEFLSVPKKQQVTALLEAMPMQADFVKLAAVVAPVMNLQPLGDMHAMDAIATVHKLVFDQRTGDNRMIKEKTGAVSQLEQSIPDALAEVDAIDETMLEKAIEDAGAVRDAELLRITNKLAGLEAEWTADISALKQKIHEIELRAEQARSAAEKQKQITQDQYTADTAPIRSSLQTIRDNRDAAAKARATRDNIDKMRDELVDLQGKADAATAAIDALEAYKSDLLATLPIPGLEVREGEIWFNGVLFDRLNSAQQVRVAVEVAKLRAGRLGIVCVDGIERLDNAAFDDFRQQALESGVQLVVTRVGDDGLAVEVAK